MWFDPDQSRCREPPSAPGWKGMIHRSQNRKDFCPEMRKQMCHWLDLYSNGRSIDCLSDWFWTNRTIYLKTNYSAVPVVPTVTAKRPKNNIILRFDQENGGFIRAGLLEKGDQTMAVLFGGEEECRLGDPMTKWQPLPEGIKLQNDKRWKLSIKCGSNATTRGQMSRVCSVFI